MTDPDVFVVQMGVLKKKLRRYFLSKATLPFILNDGTNLVRIHINKQIYSTILSYAHIHAHTHTSTYTHLVHKQIYSPKYIHAHAHAHARAHT